MEAAQEQFNRHGDDTVASAINEVLDSTGDSDSCLGYRSCDGIAVLGSAAARRIVRRARLGDDPLALDPLAFVDREDALYIGFDAA